MADEDSSVRGRGSLAAIAVAIVRVAATRAVSTSRRYEGVQGRSPSPGPARFTTASAPTSAVGSTVPAAGSQRASSVAPGSRRTSRSTWCPSPRSDAVNAPPSSPDPPVRTTFICASQPEVRLEGAFFEASLHRGQKACGVCPVHDPVVVGERQVAHRPDRDGLTEVLVVDDDRALDDRAGAEDADLRLVDDRGVE